MNFNPGFVFDGSDDFMELPTTLKPTGGNYAYTYFRVGNTSGATNVLSI